MKLLILFTLVLNFTVSLAQRTEQEYIATVEKDTLYWQSTDSVSMLMLHKLDNSQEKLLHFNESKPNEAIRNIKFDKDFCGILFENGVGHAYFLLSKINDNWKIISIHNWYDNMTSVNPSDILSISLDSTYQLTVIKKTKSREVLSFDSNGKMTVTKI